ncbi:MAG: hypothetical protein HYR55_14375 [Acidobacteria bacterium]|nr:hypothetical protein [Acidobacteriota bacterium]MBI3658724.1 hypothetical protein [Acidobacteriota bacterium]
MTAALQKMGIPYLISGALASSIYGIPRASQDIYLVAAIKEDQVTAFVQDMQAEFYVDETMIRRAIQQKSSFNLIQLDTTFKVDIFISKDSEFARQEMSRRRAEVLSPDTEQTACVASPEDLLLEKLAWYKLGGGVSDQQWKDVLGVIKVQWAHLDMAYLKRWAEPLGVANHGSKPYGRRVTNSLNRPSGSSDSKI